MERKEPEQRPGPFEQDRSRTPPTKEQREKDYQPEKKKTGEAIKGERWPPIQDVNRTRENNDPAAFSDKPQLNEKGGDGLRGQDKRQGDLKDEKKTPPE